MSGYIYVMTNPCFSGTGPVKMYKIGYTADMEQRKKSYATAFPMECIYDVDPTGEAFIPNIRTRERLIFKRLNEYRFNSSREYFCADINLIKQTINSVKIMSLKEMNLELNIKEWKVEVPIFLKKVIKEVKTGKSYNKVLVEDLYRLFVVWCMAKNIKKKIKEEEFDNDLENYKLKQKGKVIKFKSTKTHPKEYLEMIEYNI
jgi:hypothetical protein